MRTTPSDRTLTAVALAALVGLGSVPGLGAQETRIVTSEIAVSGRESSLELGLSGDRTLSIALRAGEVVVDGDEVGSYVPSGTLERSWRELLGRAATLDDGPLATSLAEWSPPGDLEGDAAEVAARIDRRLEGAVAGAPTGEPAAQETGATEEPTRTLPAAESLGVPLHGVGALLRTLQRTGALAGLGDVFEDVDLDRVRLYPDEDVTVREGQTVEGTMVVMDGDIDVYGTVEGDVVAVDGDVTVHEDARIEGKVRVIDGEVHRYGGVVTGSVRTVDPDDVRVRSEAMGAEFEEEIERRITERLGHDRSRFSWPHPIRYIVQGLGGLVQTMAIWAVLVGIGLLLVYFARERLEVIADTARHATSRSALVGVAGAFLSLPVYILGTIALAVSIIGIPVLVAWVPLFPVVVALAGALGYLAVAHSLGEFIAQQRFNGWEWLRRSNSYYYVATGMVALLAAYAVGHVIRMGGSWLGFLHGIVMTIAVLVTLSAVMVGFGAVLLTRGGRIRELAGPAAGPDPGVRDPDLGDASGTEATDG